MILHLLSLGRHSTKKSSAGEHQILTLLEILLVNQEVLLLWTYCSGNTSHGSISEKVKHLGCLSVQRLHGTKKRSLLVQCLSAVGAERCRNIQGLILDESRGGRVPCCIASCLEGSTKAS